MKPRKAGAAQSQPGNKVKLAQTLSSWLLRKEWRQTNTTQRWRTLKDNWDEHKRWKCTANILGLVFWIHIFFKCYHTNKVSSIFKCFFFFFTRYEKKPYWQETFKCWLPENWSGVRNRFSFQVVCHVIGNKILYRI